MLGKLLAPTIEELIQDRDYLTLKKELSGLPAADLADLLADFEGTRLPLVFRLLNKDKATDAFEHLDVEQQQHLLEVLTADESRALLTDMSVDDRTALLDEVPPEVASRLIGLLSEQDRASALAILNYPEYSCGRLMTPDYVALNKDMTVQDSLERIRRFGKDKETVYACYVIGPHRKLLGFVSLRKLVTSSLEARIVDLMEANFVYLRTDMPQEEAVDLLRRYDLIALPVLDSEGAMVGIVTFDDVMDVAEDEFREDMENFAAVVPGDETMLEEGIMSSVWRRSPWLVGLLAVQGCAAMVLSVYDELLATFITLSFFLPALTATGGNTGTQSAAMVIRELATGDVVIGDLWKIVRRSVVAGLALAALLGVAAFVLALVIGGNPLIGVCVALGVATVVIMSNIAGSALPILLKRVGLDPALMSGPFISTLVDVAGLIIYLNISKAILGYFS